MVIAVVRRSWTKAKVVHALMNASGDAAPSRVVEISTAAIGMIVHSSIGLILGVAV